MTTRRAREADLPQIRRIEAACEQRFVDAGIYFGALADPAVIPDVYRAACSDGALLVIVDPADLPIGFAVLDVVDGSAHLAEIDIAPEHQGRGLGTMLLEAACGWAVGRRRASISLTTFRQVPWNGPYYARRGWVELGPATIGPELAAILADEVRRGLDQRCAMRRRL